MLKFNPAMVCPLLIKLTVVRPYVEEPSASAMESFGSYASGPNDAAVGVAVAVAGDVGVGVGLCVGVGVGVGGVKAEVHMEMEYG